VTTFPIHDEDTIDLSDEELSALALAADPDAPLDDDAVPLSLYGLDDLGALPLWYMPPVMARRASGWRVPMVVVLIAAFLLIDAFGLCATYGQLGAA
jgi:hypothetical protein